MRKIVQRVYWETTARIPHVKAFVDKPQPLSFYYTTFVVFNLFYYSTKSLLLEMKCVSEHQELRIFVLNLNKYE